MPAKATKKVPTKKPTKMAQAAAETQMGESQRSKIKSSKILRHLIDHVEGKRDMSATQISAGLGLLKKVMPDLATKTIQGPDGGPIPVEVKEIRMRLVRADNK